ncbi:MAG TPA: metalloregulator ArsR/SmtB family transcription factor [Kiritimatiellia bacterium]|nr:metalloregulator ArsR/SmtB family transcription factor [Kiritimatiellia bacterium]
MNMKQKLFLPNEEALARARVLKALAHPLRLQVVYALQHGETCICELEPFFQRNQSNLSRHVNQLKQAGLVAERRAGPRVMLRLATPCILRAFDCAMEVVKAEHQRRARGLAHQTA